MNYGDEGVHYEFKDGVVKSKVTEDDQKNLGITEIYLTMHFLPYANSLKWQEAAKLPECRTSSPA